MSRDDVAWLTVTDGREVVFERSLALADTSNYGYEGCWVEHLAWVDGCAVAISHERHIEVWSVHEGVARSIPIDDPYAVVGDLVVSLSRDPGLLEVIGLASLERNVPLPIRPPAGFVRLARDGGEVVVREFHQGAELERLRLPAPTQRGFPGEEEDLLGRVGRALFEPRSVPPSGRALVESTAFGFARREQPGPSPSWLLAYWHRHLVESGHPEEAAELLTLLDAIAKPVEQQPERGWEPGSELPDGAVALAVRHVRRRAGAVARACREGQLPRGVYCSLFWTAAGGELRFDGQILPPAARSMFETLAPAKPREFRWRP